MRNAIGFLIILWGLSNFFTASFVALDSAAEETFKAIEAAAITSQQKMYREE